MKFCNSSSIFQITPVWSEWRCVPIELLHSTVVINTHLFMHYNNSRFIEINIQECEIDCLSTDVLYKGDTLHDLNKEFQGRTENIVYFNYILSI
jgi:hypothetical protein